MRRTRYTSVDSKHDIIKYIVFTLERAQKLCKYVCLFVTKYMVFIVIRDANGSGALALIDAE